jgi:hypothetical protein
VLVASRVRAKLASRLAIRPAAQVAVWTTVNVVLALLFAALLLLDDASAQAAGL